MKRLSTDAFLDSLRRRNGRRRRRRRRRNGRQDWRRDPGCCCRSPNSSRDAFARPLERKSPYFLTPFLPPPPPVCTQIPPSGALSLLSSLFFPLPPVPTQLPLRGGGGGRDEEGMGSSSFSSPPSAFVLSYPTSVKRKVGRARGRRKRDRHGSERFVFLSHMRYDHVCMVQATCKG